MGGGEGEKGRTWAPLGKDDTAKPQVINSPHVDHLCKTKSRRVCGWLCILYFGRHYVLFRRSPLSSSRSSVNPLLFESSSRPLSSVLMASCICPLSFNAAAFRW